MSPPSNNNNYRPSLYTETDEVGNEFETRPVIKIPIVLETVPTLEETAEAQEVKDDDEDLQTKVELRRPSPPSFLKHLTEELQLEEPIKQLQSPNQSFHYSKQHTGLKNLSFNVGAAVMPTAKMEFDEEQPASFGNVKINRPARKLFPDLQPHKIIGRKKHIRLDLPNPEKLIYSKSAENLTDQGYLDLKFYHNKLWWSWRVSFLSFP